jgi:hypothetical protein
MTRPNTPYVILNCVTSTTYDLVLWVFAQLDKM